MVTVRPHSIAPEQSRAAPNRDSSHKRPGLFKRYKPRPSGSIPTSLAPSMPQASSSPSLQSSSSRSYRNRKKMLTPPTTNPMQWLQRNCPQDLIPRVLAFAGPQMMAVIANTNRFWNNFVKKESTWKTLSEELYKWKEGDEIPESWRDFYRFNPCVPVDYSSVGEALSVAQTSLARQTRSIRILLRPGKYILREPINFRLPCTIEVVIETMVMPDSLSPTIRTLVETKSFKRRRKSANLRKILSCRRVEVEDIIGNAIPNFMEPGAANANSAILILDSNRLDEPIIRIKQGKCTLRNLKLWHNCLGMDIWNGNAAVQIQPFVGLDYQQRMVLPTPSVVLDHVEITSASGRGIVNIDGGHVSILSCYIHECAATGIYVGGPGSRAVIESTDVVRNGNGNTQNRRGISRGHSGIYLEQGHAHVKDCNVSLNSLTGISAVSANYSVLNLEESDLVSNGTFQIEMPRAGSRAHRQSFIQNNNFSTTGLPRLRSGLVFAKGTN